MNLHDFDSLWKQLARPETPRRYEHPFSPLCLVPKTRIHRSGREDENMDEGTPSTLRAAIKMGNPTLVRQVFKRNPSCTLVYLLLSTEDIKKLSDGCTLSKQRLKELAQDC